MELRKDPITRSWVITGDDVIETAQRSQACPFCGPFAEPAQVVANMPGADGSTWSARSVVHPQALYHIEGEAARRGDGLYDRMGSVGAHEVLIENPRHDGHIWNASDFEVEHFLRLAALRIQDLKRDSRFKYVSIFKNHGKPPDRNSPTPLRNSPPPYSFPAACSMNSVLGENILRAKSAASFATFWRRKNVRACVWSRLAETTSHSAPMPRSSVRNLGHPAQPRVFFRTHRFNACWQPYRSSHAIAADPATHTHRDRSISSGAPHLA